MTIHLKGFEANQTLETVQTGIEEGGRQIGQFSSKDNDYNPPGYSTLPTVKADENGNAKDLRSMLKYLKVWQVQRFV